jgi:hypothetical protein
MKKKAEITTQQIVLLIILIVSFAVILFFLLRLNLGKASDEEVCHNSVVTRGSGVIPKESVPLNCKTSYICITKDGSCEKMTSPEIMKVGTKDEVYKVLADKMADCWWMFGEGKLNYVGNTFLSQLYCSICSQVAFDNSLDGIFTNGEIDKKDFYNYLSVTSISNKDISYLDYLMGLKNSQTIEDALKENDPNLSFGKINIGKQYSIVMGIFSEVGVGTWIATGVGAGIFIAGITIVTGGVGTAPAIILIGSGAIGGGVGGYMMGTAVRGESGHDYLSPTIIETNSADIDNLRCASIKTLA